MQIDISQQSGRTLVQLGGEVDLSSTPDLRKALLAEIKKKKNGIVVDLSNVPYIDSSGIATLVEGYKKCRDGKLEFALIGVTAGPLQVLQLTRLDQVFPMFDNLDQVLAAQ